MLSYTSPAVLFLVFNRPDTTAKVFEAIRKAKPARLYIAADGPRDGRADEAKRVREVRDIATAVDWPCNVRTLFREENLGCKRAISNAITWFFANEEEGIILEDDCLPDPYFFQFCEKSLRQFKENPRIGAVGGFVAFRNEVPFLNLHGSVWGWATWRDRWALFDKNMVLDTSGEIFVTHELPFTAAIPKLQISRELKMKKKDTWDYFWLFSRLNNKMYTVLPGAPLVQNIGFAHKNAAHTRRKKPISLRKLENICVKSANIDIERLNSVNLKNLEKKRILYRFGRLGTLKNLLRCILKDPSVLFHYFNQKRFGS